MLMTAPSTDCPKELVGELVVCRNTELKNAMISLVPLLSGVGKGLSRIIDAPEA